MFSIDTAWCHLAVQQRGFCKRKLEELIILRNMLLAGIYSRAQEQDVSCLELGSLGGKWPRASPLPASSVKQNFSLSKRRKLCLGACKRSQELQRRAERFQEGKNEGRSFPTRLCRLLVVEESTRRARRRWSRRGTLLVGGGLRAERPAGPQQGQHHGWEASMRGRPPPGAAAQAALFLFLCLL